MKKMGLFLITALVSLTFTGCFGDFFKANALTSSVAQTAITLRAQAVEKGISTSKPIEIVSKDNDGTAQVSLINVGDQNIYTIIFSNFENNEEAITIKDGSIQITEEKNANYPFALKGNTNVFLISILYNYQPEIKVNKEDNEYDYNGTAKIDSGTVLIDFQEPIFK